MSEPVFFADPLPVVGPALLDGAEGYHAARVRRLRVGETLMLTDGRGGVARCQVTAVRGGELELHVSATEQRPRPAARLTVVQALPKGDRGELAVELLAELGVDEIVPWSAARCVTQWRGERGERGAQRWRRTAQEAAKQSRRTWWPKVSDVASTEQVALRLQQADAAFALHESATEHLVSADLPGSLSAEIALVVGPEGGLTDEELATFAQIGVEIVRLGETVLRTSTAGAAAAAVISSRIGRWG